MKKHQGTTYLIDTHALVFWLLEPAKLSLRGREILSNPENRIVVSVMTLLELEYLREIGRIEVNLGDVLAFFHQNSNYHIQSFDETVLLRCLEVSDQRDPFDRIILATGISLKLPIITRDRWMQQRYEATVW